MPTQNPRKKKQSHWHKDDLALPWRSAVFPKYHLWHRYKALSVLILRLLKREPVGQKLIWKMKETGFSLCPLLNTCKMFRVVCFHNRNKSLKNWPQCYKSSTGVYASPGRCWTTLFNKWWLNCYSTNCSKGLCSGCALYALTVTLDFNCNTSVSQCLAALPLRSCLFLYIDSLSRSISWRKSTKDNGVKQMELIKKCKIADSLGSCTWNVPRSQTFVVKEITALWAVCCNCSVSCFPKARPKLFFTFMF